MNIHVHVHGNYCIIMKSVDSISRDGPDTPILYYYNTLQKAKYLGARKIVSFITFMYEQVYNYTNLAGSITGTYMYM